MKQINLWTASQKEAYDYIEAALNSRKVVEEIVKNKMKDKKKEKLSEEEKQQLIEEAIERQNRQKILQLANDKVALEYVYQARTEEFKKAIKMLLKKELSMIGKDFIACFIFPYGDTTMNTTNVDLSSVVQVYVKINGENNLRLFAILYRDWRTAYDKLPLTYTLQSNYLPTPIVETSFKSFYEVEGFDGNTTSVVY